MTSQQIADHMLAVWQNKRELRAAQQQVNACMAIRDLINATIVLSELPLGLVRQDYKDIELVRDNLNRLLGDMK